MMPFSLFSRSRSSLPLLGRCSPAIAPPMSGIVGQIYAATLGQLSLSQYLSGIAFIFILALTIPELRKVFLLRAVVWGSWIWLWAQKLTNNTNLPENTHHYRKHVHHHPAQHEFTHKHSHPPRRLDQGPSSLSLASIAGSTSLRGSTTTTTKPTASSTTTSSTSSITTSCSLSTSSQPSSSSAAVAVAGRSSRASAESALESGSRTDAIINDINFKRKPVSKDGVEYAKLGSFSFFRPRNIYLRGCSIILYYPSTGALDTEFKFEGGKVVLSRTAHALKVVNADSELLYIKCINDAKRQEWIDAINHNLHAHLAADWVVRARAMGQAATASELRSHRTGGLTATPAKGGS